MLGFFAAIYSGLSFVFACVGVAFVVYKLYQWYRNRNTNSAHLNQDLEGTQSVRLEREDAVSQYAIQSNVHLHENAHQIVNRCKEQQHHLSISIKAFDQMLEHAKETNSGLDEAGRSFYYTVIAPMKILLERIKAQFKQSSALLSNLSNAFTESNQALVNRERELGSVVQNISETESSLRGVRLQAEYVKGVEEKNRALERALSKLTTVAKRRAEIVKRQERLITLLQDGDACETGHDFKLFGNGVEAELPSMDNEKKQDTLGDFADYAASFV